MESADFCKLGEGWGGREWQRPLARALVAAGLLTGAFADVTVRRYASGARKAPDEIINWLRAQNKRRRHWAVGRTEHKERVVVHLTQPRFCATITNGAIASIDWFDTAPDKRLGGKLLAEALDRGA